MVPASDVNYRNLEQQIGNLSAQNVIFKRDSFAHNAFRAFISTNQLKNVLPALSSYLIAKFVLALVSAFPASQVFIS